MPRLRLRVVAVLIIGLAGVPAGALPLHAQGAEPRTVTIKPGDTLWGLARQYLGDSFLWPEIYRLNTGLVEDPHWIYPGQVLKLPGGNAMVLPTSGEPSAPRQGPRQGTRMTVFNPDFDKASKGSRASLNLGARTMAVRSGEFTGSPFMWSVGGPTDGGYVESTAESQGIAMTIAQRPIQYREAVFVHLPRGAPGTVGERLLVYRLGELVEGQGQVVIPTGIVRLTTAPADGRAQAELERKFEDVYAGQGASVADTLQIAAGKSPLRVEFGLSTTVSWLYQQHVLPTTGQYLILTAGSKEGLTPGDQVSLRRERPTDAAPPALPDEEIAVAQVTRVTPWGASAIVIKQQQVGIMEGMRARVTAKMP